MDVEGRDRMSPGLSIIEQAAKRLEELRRSGIEVSTKGTVSSSPTSADHSEAVPVRLARMLEEGKVKHGEGLRDPQRPALRDVSPVPRPVPSKESSRHIDIDLKRLAAMGYLTPETPRARIADEFRVIKRPLLGNVNGKSASPMARSNLIMVTSSLPGEGKTFVSVNLAISLAMELDKTVLLVDADVSRPSVLKRLGLPPSPGLMDILTNSSLQVSEVMMRTNVDKLTILPSGQANGRATELLASDAMNQLLDELSARYSDRIVVFDAPPLLPSTESRVLATYMGQVVVVVEADRTPQKSLSQALSTIEACPVVLSLLNKINRSEVGSYYGYYDPV
jgi:protein-tyrosine kinase